MLDRNEVQQKFSNDKFSEKRTSISDADMDWWCYIEKSCKITVNRFNGLLGGLRYHDDLRYLKDIFHVTQTMYIRRPRAKKSSFP